MGGSVILAGILLKLGGYGFIRILWPLLPEACHYLSPIVLTFSVLGIIFGSLTTCRQCDLKRLVAYSSVAHMGLITTGLFSHSTLGFVGAIFLMLAHGLVSPALFIAISWLYDRFGTRLIRYFRGLVSPMPLFSAFFDHLIGQCCHTY